jgi:hypothetical protein
MKKFTYEVGAIDQAPGRRLLKRSIVAATLPDCLGASEFVVRNMMSISFPLDLSEPSDFFVMENSAMHSKDFIPRNEAHKYSFININELWPRELSMGNQVYYLQVK